MQSSGKVLRVIVLLLVVSGIGTLGYRVLLGWTWLDSLYMTMITVTTVGFGEVRPMTDGGHVFTMLLMLSSVGIVAYSATQMASVVMEAQLHRVVWRRRMEKRIAALHDHFVICGLGRTGEAVCRQMQGWQLPFVVVEHSQEVAEPLQERGWPFVVGDASDDACLLAAGIDRAKGLVAALGNDAENVYLVLSARLLNPRLVIASWSSSEDATYKIKRAGADHVLSPYALGGSRIAHLLTAPHAVAFLDHAMAGSDSNVRLAEIEVEPGSRLVGSSLQKVGIRRDLGVIMIGIRRADGSMVFNPSAEVLFHAHDILIGIGSEEQLNRLRALI